MRDPVLILMRVCWFVGNSIGLALTSAGGIMLNHYVRLSNYVFLDRAWSLYRMNVMTVFRTDPQKTINRKKRSVGLVEKPYIRILTHYSPNPEW